MLRISGTWAGFSFARLVITSQLVMYFYDTTWLMELVLAPVGGDLPFLR